jgi:HCOMODA/2-hydroxy-3-carboxy-muconic semialdehyde decarboxylase
MPSSADALIDDLVTANHILFDQGVLDAFGHVSVRDPHDAQRFHLSRSLAPSRVRAADIVQYRLDGSAVKEDAPKGYLERYIHSEIYRARPDVQSIVHSHSASVIPFGASNVAMKPMFHVAGFLRGVRKFDIREASGRSTDMLVSSPELGTYLARALGPSDVALMCGHGCVVLGASLKLAVFRAVYTEVNARIQQQAHQLGGDYRTLDDEEARLADEANSGQVDRPWQLWAEAARQRRA